MVKHKYKSGDLITTKLGVGKIEDLQTSTVDNKSIPSYWVKFEKKVYPDGCARNVWESSILGYFIRELKFEGIDWWNRPVFKDKFGYRFGSVDCLYTANDSVDKIIDDLSDGGIVYFGSSFGCEPDGTRIDKNKIKLVKEFTKIKILKY